jgi:hypothetical protein
VELENTYLRLRAPVSVPCLTHSVSGTTSAVMIKYILISEKEYKALYHQIGLKFKNERNERCILRVLCVMLKVGHFGKPIRNSSKASICGSGERRGRSVGLIVLKMKKYYKSSTRKCDKKLTRLTSSCVRTAF